MAQENGLVINKYYNFISIYTLITGPIQIDPFSSFQVTFVLCNFLLDTFLLATASVLSDKAYLSDIFLLLQLLFCPIEPFYRTSSSCSSVCLSDRALLSDIFFLLQRLFVRYSPSIGHFSSCYSFCSSNRALLSDTFLQLPRLIVR